MTSSTKSEMQPLTADEERTLRRIAGRANSPPWMEKALASIDQLRAALRAADGWFSKSMLAADDDGVDYLNDGGWRDGEVVAKKVRAVLAKAEGR